MTLIESTFGLSQRFSSTVYLGYYVGLETAYRAMPSAVLGLNRARFRYTNILASYLEARNLMVYIACFYILGVFLPPKIPMNGHLNKIIIISIYGFKQWQYKKQLETSQHRKFWPKDPLLCILV